MSKLTHYRLVLPNAALRALAQSFEKAADDRFLELSIRALDYELNIREFSAYLAFLDGVYGRLDPLGYRSYVQQPNRQLQIARIHRGSIDLTFVFDLLRQDEIWRGLILYVIARISPAIIRGEAAKNWAEAGKAAMDTYVAYRGLQSDKPVTTDHLPAAPEPPRALRSEFSVPLQLTRKQESHLLEVSEPRKFKLTRKQRQQIKLVMASDPSFAKLNERHRSQVIRLIQEVLSQEQHRLPAAMRFAGDSVVEVTVSLKPGVQVITG